MTAGQAAIGYLIFTGLYAQYWPLFFETIFETFSHIKQSLIAPVFTGAFWYA